MDSEIKIETIKLKVAGQTLELTLEQARALKDTLEDLFPTPKFIPSPPQIIREYERRRDNWPIPSYPWQQPIITCQAGGRATLTMEAR